MITPNVLNSAFERVARAQEHLTDLRFRIDSWLLDQEEAVRFEFDSNPPHNGIVNTSKCINPPPIIGIIIGEAAHNLRSALNYLVFELAKLDSSSEQKGTQFPIEDDPNRFRGNAPRFLVGLNPLHVAAIEWLQPYNGVVWAGWLRDISNTDKHRKLTDIKGDWTAHIEVDPYGRLRDQPFPASDKPIRRTHHPVHGEVHVKIALTSTITLDDGTFVTDALQEISAQVGNTLRNFEPEF